MKRILLLAAVFISLPAINAQAIRFSTYDGLEREILADTAGVTVLNFWATWCRPCIEELPDFERLNVGFREKNVKVILANLDFHSKVETQVKEFMVRNALSSKVVHITDEDSNLWIGKASAEWSGALPATIIFFKGKKVWFREGTSTYAELVTEINKYIHP